MSIPGERSIREVVSQWRPTYNDKWMRWIRDAYTLYIATDDNERLRGVKDFATILGDSGAPELCVLVALYGLTFVKTERDRNAIESHIRIVACELGMVRHTETIPPHEGIPAVDFADRKKWLINRSAWENWRNHKLNDFGGDRRSASDFSVRLTCIRAGILAGGVEPTFESVCDSDLWQTTNAEPKD